MIMRLLKKVGLDKFLPNSYNWITVSAASKLLENNQLLMIDVRSKTEWESTGVPLGSHCIELQNPNFIERVSKLCNDDTTQQIALSCLSGHRAKKAAKRLKRTGFDNLFCVEGGITEWNIQNLPVINLTSQEKN